eukprot:1183673-Prorocentrum_minimum.AAC.1
MKPRKPLCLLPSRREILGNPRNPRNSYFKKKSGDCHQILIRPVLFRSMIWYKCEMPGGTTNLQI